MGEVIVITSGKGGVGKTTTTANIGAGLSKLGKKVVIIDTDLGLRNLDVVMGMENLVVYNLVDVVDGSCRLKQALIRDSRYENLYLLPSAQTKDKSAVSPGQMKKLTAELKEEFDYILLDCPAGIEQGFQNAIAGADRALVVTTPEVSSIRDADRIIGLLEQNQITHRVHRKNIQHTALKGSPLQLRQIMLNLFSNAVKYNKPQGSVDTGVEELSCDGKTAWYEFRIADTGIGMSGDFVKNQLFEPFTQEQYGARTRYQGTGLGMSIVKGLVEKMNGTIEVQSVPGQGSTFTVTLPFRIGKAEPSKEQETEQKQEKLLTGKRILLVEDNEINMEIAQFYLEDGGAAVDIAWNGAQAVNRFAASKEGYYDMILMDVMMPVMDGLEACRRIRALEQERREHVCIYAMTAQASSESEQQCLEAGMDGHIAKPIEAEELVKTILTVTGKEVSDTR